MRIQKSIWRLLTRLLLGLGHVRELMKRYQIRDKRGPHLDAAKIHPDTVHPAPPPLMPLPLVRWTQPDGVAKDVTVIGYLRTASGVGEGRATDLAHAAG